MFRFAGLLIVMLSFLAVASVSGSDVPAIFPEVPVKGMVTLVDVGGESCTPCRMMVPILQQLQEKYRDRAAVIAINVGKNRDRSKLYGARIIPTQIFYDKEGREVVRHEGFMDKKSIVEIMDKLVSGQ
jgi:thioredoxin 1